MAKKIPEQAADAFNPEDASTMPSTRLRTRPKPKPATDTDTVVDVDAHASAGDKHYAVGYSKPPKDTQFKPGRSGNPKGRPVRPPTMKTEVRQFLKRKTTITENGVQRQVPMTQGSLLALGKNALKGNIEAIKTMLSLYREHDEALEAEAVTSENQHAAPPLSADDLKALEIYKQALLQGHSDTAIRAADDQGDDPQGGPPC